MSTKYGKARADRTRYSYRVTIDHGDGGSIIDDIALRAASIEHAREIVTIKMEERYPTSSPTFTVKRISDAECEAIIDAGGIDWATR